MQTALLKDKRLFAVRALFSSRGAVLYVTFESTLHAVLPRVDVVRRKFQRRYQLDYLFNGHLVAQHARDKFRIVPELGVESLG